MSNFYCSTYLKGFIHLLHIVKELLAKAILQTYKKKGGLNFIKNGWILPYDNPILRIPDTNTYAKS